MDFLSKLSMGFGQATQPYVLLLTFVGTVVGTLIGVLPGLGAAATIAILLPITYGLNPLAAIAMLCGVYFGSQYGGSTTSILLNVPGETASVVTCIDGYEMTKRGRAGVALGISGIGSFVGGTVGLIALVMIAEPLANVAISFGPPEYAALMLLGLSMTTSLGGNQIKAVVMCLFGLVLGAIGSDPLSGLRRLTFGLEMLEDGIDIVPVAVGLFAMSEVLSNLEEGIGDLKPAQFTPRLRELLPKLRDLRDSAWSMVRGTVIGFMVGVLPGGGAGIASFLSYTVERRMARHPEMFGHGAIEGVAGPETANNSAVSGAMIPLLVLGIPGSAAAAVMAGGFMMNGLRPGPLLFQKNPEFVWGLIATMYLGNVTLLILNLPLIGIWVRLLTVPYYLLLPVIVAISAIGTFSVNYSTADLWLMLFLGAVGFCARKAGYPLAPVILGLILGPVFEQSFNRSLIMSAGNPIIFFTRPISILLISLTVIGMTLPVVWSHLKGKRKARQP